MSLRTPLPLFCRNKICRAQNKVCRSFGFPSRVLTHRCLGPRGRSQPQGQPIELQPHDFGHPASQERLHHRYRRGRESDFECDE